MDSSAQQHGNLAEEAPGSKDSNMEEEGDKGSK